MALLDPYAGPWTSALATHLLRRAGFGGKISEINSSVASGMVLTVNSILDYPATDTTLDNLIAALPASTENDRLKNPFGSSQIEGWWLYRMVNSSYPMQQQLALFYHDTMVSEWGKVSSNVTTSSSYGNDGSTTGQSCTVAVGGLPPLTTRQQELTTRIMLDQYRLFEQSGHLSYGELLRQIARDPCMLIYLDNRLNVKGKPQENFSREIMELFSMGVGNYSEEDVREAARAFTGETIDNRCLQNWPYTYFHDATKHDTNSKTVFGSTFNLPGSQDTDRVIDLVLSRVSNAAVSPAHSRKPATSLYISWALLKWFVSDTIEITHPVVEELANYFYNNTTGGGYRYNVRETLRKLFCSQFFYAAENRYNMYKRPADYMVHALRNLDLVETSFTGTAYSRLRSMGMRLFQPPNVAGWNHGRSWINSGNLIARFNYADRLSGSTISTDAYVDALITNGHVLNTNDNVGVMKYYSDRLLNQDLSPEEVQVFQSFYSQVQGTTVTASASQFRRKARGTLHLMMTMPRYQLK